MLFRGGKLGASNNLGDLSKNIKLICHFGIINTVFIERKIGVTQPLQFFTCGQKSFGSVRIGPEITEKKLGPALERGRERKQSML